MTGTRQALRRGEPGLRAGFLETAVCLKTYCGLFECAEAFEMDFLQISQAICVHVGVSFLLSVMLHSLHVTEGTCSLFSTPHVRRWLGWPAVDPQGGAGAGVGARGSAGVSARAGGSAARCPPARGWLQGWSSGVCLACGLMGQGVCGQGARWGWRTGPRGPWPSGQWQHTGDSRRAWDTGVPLPGGHAPSRRLHSAPAVASCGSCQGG